MSKRTQHGIKSNGQASFRRQAEQVEAFFAYANRANTQYGEKPFMRQECYCPDAKVSYRKHKVVA